MNKRCFRLIFSKALGFLIPVAEITRAQRKPGQADSGAVLKPLLVSLLAAGVPGWASAQMVAAPSTGTQVISAANGVPVIEIANPNGSGLSHNRFGEFDVSAPGVIFNNSRANGVSQLGGAILGNPNLQRQATAILSEVTGTKPSSISGTLEVFGGRADILIAKDTNNISDIVSVELANNQFSLLPTLLLQDFFNPPSTVGQASVEPKTSVSKGVGTVPGSKQLHDLLSNRRFGSSSTAGSDPVVENFAVEQKLIDRDGRLTVSGMAHLGRMNDERRLLIALQGMKDQSELLARYNNRQKNTFIYSLASRHGVDQKTLKKYVNDSKAIDDAIETIKIKWAD